MKANLVGDKREQVDVFGERTQWIAFTRIHILRQHGVVAAQLFEQVFDSTFIGQECGLETGDQNDPGVLRIPQVLSTDVTVGEAQVV
ncbi:hypothetical protein D3C85_1715680 [compost metagenome]